MKIATMLMALVISGTVYANDHEGHEEMTTSAAEMSAEAPAPAKKAPKKKAFKKEKKQHKKKKKGAQH